jgi:CheY-like chemotaxis protein
MPVVIEQPMTFQALLVSTDDAVAQTLTPVLSGFGLAVRGCEYAAAVGELTGQRYDAVLVDFDDPQRASLVLQNASLASPHNGAITVALLRDPGKVRQVFGAGANFVLYKPISPEQAQASLRAATALMKRERRRSLRVPVQVSVELRVANGLDVEGILLDLSEDGLEVLSSQPLCPSASLSLLFRLPEGAADIQAQGQVAWASPNGQSGVRFVELSEATRAQLREWVSSHAALQPPEDGAAQCKLSDLSQGGCYMETESPFPERSEVTLRLYAEGFEVQAQGMVRVMHPGFGMGVEFASSTAQQQEAVANFIRFLRSRPGISPQLLVMPRALADSADSSHFSQDSPSELSDPLLDLLRNHEALSQEAFLHELQRQRNSELVASN